MFYVMYNAYMGEKFSNPMLEAGRITIPADTREKLELEHGDYLIVEVEKLD